jgi:Family of unknown function (DUF5677)
MQEFNINEQNLLRYTTSVIDYFALLKLMPRDFRLYPFDTVGLELLSKSVSITRSCLILIGNTQSDEAFGLSRSLVEAALILRHITRDQSLMFRESQKFLRFAFADKNFWHFHARKTFKHPKSVEEINHYTSGWKFADGNPMAATRTWSDKYNAWKAQTEDHPLDTEDDAQEERIGSHAVAYTQASFFVHCTQPSLDNFFPQAGMPFEIRRSSAKFVDSRGTIFYVLLTNLHKVVLYVLFGLNFDTPASLVELFNKILDNAEPTADEIYLMERNIKRWQR